MRNDITRVHPWTAQSIDAAIENVLETISKRGRITARYLADEHADAILTEAQKDRAQYGSDNSPEINKADVSYYLSCYDSWTTI